MKVVNARTSTDAALHTLNLRRKTGYLTALRKLCIELLSTNDKQQIMNIRSQIQERLGKEKANSLWAVLKMYSDIATDQSNEIIRKQRRDIW